jgi:hypothetical protein
VCVCECVCVLTADAPRAAALHVLEGRGAARAVQEGVACLHRSMVGSAVDMVT